MPGRPVRFAFAAMGIVELRKMTYNSDAISLFGGGTLTKKQRKEIAAFIAVTFCVTWLIWLGAYIVSVSMYKLPLSRDWLIRLGTAVPSATGLLLTYMFEGKAGGKAALYSLVDFKASPIWWIYSAGLFPFILLISSVIVLLSGQTLPPAQFPVSFVPLAFFYILIFMGPLGEELGWRGFLLKRLIQGRGIARAGGLLGILWSLWHVPLFFIPGTIQSELTKMGVVPAIAGYFIYTTCISILAAVLYASTKGNLLLCVIFHTVCNLSLGIVPLILTEFGAAVLLILLILASVIIIKLTGRNICGTVPEGNSPGL